jgi:ATP-dependent DNA helicase DinG
LPFAVPTDPIQAALSKRYAESGRDSFLDLALPQAVLKLRQGIGRLIRTGQDRGVVLLTDHRITSKGYGGRFQAALPVPIEAYEDVGTLIGTLGAWYGERT